MFEHLRGLLQKRGQTPASAGDERRLAAAVLLLEVARADYERHGAELATLRAGLAREFHVPETALDALLGEAALQARESVSLFDYVQTLK